VSSVDSQAGVFGVNFSQQTQAVKMTSVNTFNIPANCNAIMSFKFRTSYAAPTTVYLLGYMYGEKDLATFKVDLAGKAVLGNFPGNQWNTMYVPLTSVSENTAFRMQLVLKNNNQGTGSIYIDDIALYRLSFALAGQLWSDAGVLNEERDLME
jgi:hypothetical protein